ncbi:GNAT family N-acetyltransferase [Candidatus Woesearchaeota archaeon]|nr:GNAT family N-acetyltransferase [Candidatus Woesearchaeota archaeon]
MEFIGKTIKIRTPKLSDADNIYNNIKDKEIAKWTLRIPHPYPKDGAKKFIRRCHLKSKNKKGYFFVITNLENNNAIGGISLNEIDLKHKNAVLGYWLGKKHWGQGIMSEAVDLILKFGFKELKLHRISSDAFEPNIASQKVLKKNGFKVEGLLRETHFKHNKWQNQVAMSILKSDYK